MTSHCIKTGQTEIGTIEHNGQQFSAMGSSVHGRNVVAYTTILPRGRIVLTSWCGKTMLACRSEIVDTYRNEWGDKALALVFSLTNGRYIVGYALDDAGSLFRGELTECLDAETAADEARSLSAYWAERDAEDEAAQNDSEDDV